jgi:hypothetical protein
MQYRAYILIFLLSSFFVSCEKDELPDSTVPASNRRTVLVGLGTDNNFHAEATEKIKTLKSNWNKDFDGNLLVYSDTGDRPVLVHIYHSNLCGNVADTIETYPPENSASPETLTRVLDRVKEYRPAHSYGLVVLSHATGWLPPEMSDPPRLKAVIQDKGADEAYNYMELSDFANAIPYKLDFLIFDACFMGSVEICYELKDKTDYIVASPAEVLAQGFVYSTIMQHLFKPEADLTAVARDFYEYHNNQGGVRRSATVSVIKTAGLEELKRIYHSALDQRPPVGDLGGLQTFGCGSQKIYFDLGDYLQQNPVSFQNLTGLQAALDEC